MSVGTPVVDSWDGANRRILLKQGVTEFHWIDDIYFEYRNERRLDEAFRKWEPFMVASGNEPKGGGKATPRLLKLLLGVKVILFDEAGEVQVNGEAITDNADVDPTLFDNSTRTFPIVINYQPSAAEVIVVDAISNALDYGGVLHYDENNVSGVGQEHPVGTSANPVNNITDGLAIASLYSLREVRVLSDVNLDQDVSGFDIHSATPSLTFFPNGFKTHLSKISNMHVDGNFNDSLVTIEQCNIINALNVYGTINNSFHSGSILISASQNLNMADCESGVAGTGTPILDMNAGQTVMVSCRGYSGGLTVINCDTVGDVATLSFYDGGKPNLEPSCTNGYISIRGNGFEDDSSNGTNVDYSAWFNPTTQNELIQSLKDIMEGDVIPEATRFRILDKVSKAILVDKNATVVNGLTQLTE